MRILTKLVKISLAIVDLTFLTQVFINIIETYQIHGWEFYKMYGWTPTGFFYDTHISNGFFLPLMAFAITTGLILVSKDK